jgi:hemerythrin-like metal-binding protein
MKEILWDDELKIHVAEIDLKRRWFIDHFNLVINAHKEEAPSRTMCKILSETTEFAMNSFRTEENFMRQNHHPDYFFHFSEHRAFMENLLAFLKRVKADDKIAMAEPLNAIRIWLLHHIRAFDRRLKRPAAVYYLDPLNGRCDYPSDPLQIESAKDRMRPINF